MDSIEVVKGFLHMLDGRKPNREELERIRPDLETVYERYLKARAAGFNAVDVSDDIRTLLIMIGKKEMTRKAPFAMRRAAGLL